MDTIVALELETSAMQLEPINVELIDKSKP